MIDKEKCYGEGAFVEHLRLRLDLGVRPQLIRRNTNLIYDCDDSIIRLTPNAFRPPEDMDHINWLLLNRGLLVLDYLFKIWPGQKTEEQKRFIVRVEQRIVSTRHELEL